MDEYKHNDPSSFETGRTKPPKQYGGLIALLLVLVIFLSGLVSVLGIMNVKLFAELANRDRQKDDAISFINSNATEPPQAETEALTSPTEELSADISLNPAPSVASSFPMGGGLSLQEIYASCIDSVVSITCSGSKGSSTGTGVILTAEGFIVTNAHVVEGAHSISVLLTGGTKFDAVLVGADAVSDLAVLHIQGQDLTPATLGDSRDIQVGDTVVAIGDPLGVVFRGTMTNGIISAINRDVTTDGRTMTLIQTNAALNSGNSGGPLINSFGQVIGITSMKISTFTDAAGVEGIGFAIPTATVKEIVEQLITQGYVSGRPTLGVTGEGVSSFYQYYYRMPAGLYISSVEPGSAAALAGLDTGDILITIDESRITDMDSLNTALYSYDAGDAVTAIVYRGGRQYSVEMTLTEAKG